MARVTEGTSLRGLELPRVRVSEGLSYRGFELSRVKLYRK